MKCELCHHNDAKHVIKRRIDGVTRELFVCDACAENETPPEQPRSSAKKSPNGEAFAEPIAALLDSIGLQIADAIESKNGEPRLKDKLANKTCPGCGMSRSELRSKRRFGCDYCYHAFESDAATILAEKSSNEMHSDCAPELAPSVRREKLLRSALDQARKAEAFEKIKKLDTELKKTARANAKAARENAAWLAGNAESEVFFDRGVTLYRNLAATKFPERCSKSELETIAKQIDAATADIGIPDDIELTVNESDHITVDYVGVDAPLEEQAKYLNAYLAKLSGKLGDFARDDHFGFLSADPDHSDLGMSVSCGFSLFGLCLTHTLDAALRALERLGFDVDPDIPSVPGEVDPVYAPGCRYIVTLAKEHGSAATALKRSEAAFTELARQELYARARLIEAGMNEALYDFTLRDFVIRSQVIGCVAASIPRSEALDICYTLLLAESEGLCAMKKRELKLLRKTIDEILEETEDNPRASHLRALKLNKVCAIPIR